jgi:hypothetical protein
MAKENFPFTVLNILFTLPTKTGEVEGSLAMGGIEGSGETDCISGVGLLKEEYKSVTIDGK